MKTILALDLGTTTGWAYRDRKGEITAGTWVLQESKATSKAARLRMDRKLDARVPALYRHLAAVWRSNTVEEAGIENPIDFLVFEDVQFSSYTKQTQLWASMRAALWLFCYNNSITVDCCPVKTLKLFATGSGAADKGFMKRTAESFFPWLDVTDDNAADAIHLLRWAIKLTERVK